MKQSLVRKRRIHLVLGAVGLVMILAAVVGEVTVASNMAFKLNKAVPGASCAAPNCGVSLIALPYRTPILNSFDLCTVIGALPADIGAPASAQVLLIKRTGAGAPVSFPCNAAPGTAFPLNDGGAPGLTRGIGVRIENKIVPALSLDGIIVGSHIPGGGPAGSFTVPADTDALGPLGIVYYGVPYHTTNATAFDICANGPLDSIAPAALLTRIDGATGAPFAFTCDGAPGAAFPLVLGEAVEIRDQNPAVTFVPSHF